MPINNILISPFIRCVCETLCPPEETKSKSYFKCKGQSEGLKRPWFHWKGNH